MDSVVSAMAALFAVITGHRPAFRVNLPCLRLPGAARWPALARHYLPAHWGTLYLGLVRLQWMQAR